MSERDQQTRPTFEPLKAIGAFLLVFGLFVAGAMLLEMETGERLINLACGLVIMGSGAIAFMIGHRRGRTEPDGPGTQ